MLQATWARRLMLAGLAIGVAALWSTSVLAQGPGGGRRGGRGGFGGNLLEDPQVQKELELLDDQVEQLKEVNEKVRSQMMEMFREMRNVPREEMRERFAGLREKITEIRDKELSTVLLPDQLKRLKQIEFQQQFSRGGGRTLENPQLMERLGLSDEQIEKIRQLSEQAQEEMRKKMEQMRKELQDKVLALLTPQQRKDFDDLVGDPVELSPPQRGRRGGPGGGGPPAGGAPPARDGAGSR